jgi:hypothetical protein
MSIIPFTREIAWWPDASLVNTIKKQKLDCNVIKGENDSLRDQIQILKFQDSVLLHMKSTSVDAVKSKPINKSIKAKTTTTNNQSNQIFADNSIKDTSNNKKMISTVASTTNYKIYDSVNYDGHIYYIIGRDSKYGAFTEDGRLIQIPIIYPSINGVEKELQILLGVVDTNNIGL